MAFSLKNSILSKVWALLLFAAAIVLLAAAWTSFGSFASAGDSARCAVAFANQVNRGGATPATNATTDALAVVDSIVAGAAINATNGTGVAVATNSTGVAMATNVTNVPIINVSSAVAAFASAAAGMLSTSNNATYSGVTLPLSLLTIIADDSGYFGALVATTPTVTSLLLLVAALLLLIPRPPNPTCAKYLTAVAGWVAFVSLVIYLVMLAWYASLDTSWAIEQHEAYAAACNATPVTIETTRRVTMLNTVPVTVNGTNLTQVVFGGFETVVVRVPGGTAGPLGNFTAECTCLLDVLPSSRATWGPGLFALVALLAAWVVGATLRFVTPDASRAAGYGKADVLLGRICLGEAGLCLNVLCLPFVLLWNGFDIYFVGCLRVRARAAPACACAAWHARRERVRGHHARRDHARGKQRVCVHGSVCVCARVHHHNPLGAAV